MEAQPEFNNLNGAVKKLCAEAVKVEEELKVAEAEASLKKRSLVAAQCRNEELESELRYLESQKFKADNDLKRSEEDIACLTQRLEGLATSSTALQVEKKFIKNHSTNRENIKQLVEQRMKDWEISVTNECGVTSEEKTLTDLQHKVKALRSKRDALQSVPEKVSLLQRNLDDHLKNKAFLKKEVERLQRILMEKEQKLNHIKQEVQMYEQHNQASRLRREIDEVSAHNSCLSLELSQLEGKVTQLRDQVEAQGHIL